MAKPCIGVLPLYDEEKNSCWILPGYMKAVEEAGGVPVMLPLTADGSVIQSIAETFDGFLFTGGHDVNPAHYGEEKSPLCGKSCDERDELEISLFRRAVELDKPVFGICRGMQVINVSLGGSLYQDLPAEFESAVQVDHRQAPPYNRTVHSVTLEKDTPLHRILGVESMAINSYHHQGIKRLADRLTPAAYAEDGLVEAVFMPDRTFVWAVQWHPEYNFQADRLQFKLFVEFVNQCRNSNPTSPAR